jgi:hypothetical protein
MRFAAGRAMAPPAAPSRPYPSEFPGTSAHSPPRAAARAAMREIPSEEPESVAFPSATRLLAANAPQGSNQCLRLHVCPRRLHKDALCEGQRLERLPLSYRRRRPHYFCRRIFWRISGQNSLTRLLRAADSNPVPQFSAVLRKPRSCGG